MTRRWFAFWMVAALTLLAGCGPKNAANDASAPPTNDDGTPQTVFHIVSGSENKPLQPLLDRFARDNHIALKMDYLGSVDIMMQLQNGKIDCDAVWPANSLWLTLGDRQKQVKDAQSILWSPVALGVKKSVAAKLGWIGKQNVTVENILEAAEGGGLRFMMTSATQSNSGASAYLGFLYAFAGKPPVLTAAHLTDAQVQAKVKRLFGQVNRSAGSSGWLKDLFLQKYDAYDAMVNYEAVIIDANRELIAQGKEPLYVVYPSDGLAIADSPLGYVERGDPAKAKLFQQLQTYLLAPATQQEIMKLGRRVGPVGEELKNADKAVFNPDWGVNVSQFFNQIRYPKPEVMQQALDLYQTALRKPSYTVYCLDFSGSMRGEREERLKTAMRLILDQQQARQSLLQAAPGDVSVVITFSSGILQEWTVRGSDPKALSDLWASVNASAPDGGTDIYTPVMRALDLIEQQPNLEKWFPAVILLTDGESNEGKTMADLQAYLGGRKHEIPVYAIALGEASEEQLQNIATATSGRVFDGKADLTRAFREVKGYN